MGISPGETIASLAKRVKEKFPVYSQIDDRVLVGRIIAKYPVYQKSLSRETLEGMAEESSKELQRQAGKAPGALETVKGVAKFFYELPQNIVKAPIEAYYGAKGFRSLREAGFSEKQIVEMQRRGGIPSLRPELWKQIVDPQMEQFEIAKEAAQRGEYGQAAVRAATGANPLFGPMAAGLAETAAVHGRGAAIRQAAPLVLLGAAARGMGGARARGAQLRTAPRPAPALAPAPRLAPGPVRRALPPVRGPEIGIERELPAGGVVRPAPAPGLRVVGRGKTEGVSRVAPVVERAPQAKPVPPTKPLPPPAPIAPREAAELGVRPEEVPQVLRRQRAEATVKEKLAEAPEEGRAPAPFRTKPLEAGTKVYDKFGDELQVGRYATDPLGKRLKIEGFVETPEGATNAVVKRGKVREEINAENLMVRVKPREKGYAPSVRQFGESEEAFGARMNRERGFIRGKDLLPGEWLEAVGDIGRGLADIFKRKPGRRLAPAPAPLPGGQPHSIPTEIGKVGERLSRSAEMLLEQSENIKKTGTFEKGARPERRRMAPVQPQRLVSEKMIKDLNAEIVGAAQRVKELRAEAETTGSARMNHALEAAEQRLNLVAERYRPLPKAAGRAVKAFDVPVPEELIAELNKVGLFMKKVSKPGLSDMAYEAWVNSLLSGPPTHIVNTVSNALVRLSTPAERGLAGGIDFLRAKITRVPQERFMGEVAADIYGMTAGLKHGVRTALQAWRTEVPTRGVSKLELARQKAIPGRTGRIIRVPGRALVAADEFFKAVNETAGKHVLAYREAARQGLTGAAKTKRIAELLENPPPGLLEKAAGDMLYRVFQQPFGPSGRHMAGLRANTPGLRYIIPFLRTPINIAKYGLERTPLNFLRLAAKAFKREAPLRGGALAEELAKPVIGTLIGAGVVLWASEGYITGGGPKDPNRRRVLRETGWQPYSLKIGDTYYSFSRFEPVGALFGMAADFYDTFDDLDELEQSDLISQIVLSITRNFTSKTYLRGLTATLDAISEPERYGRYWLEGLAGTMIPTVVANVARATDPYFRRPTTPLEAIKARIPGLSRSVPASRGVFGQPVERPGGTLTRLFSPVYVSPEKGGMVEKELVRLKMGIARPSRMMTFEGQEVEMTQPEYEQFQEVSGQLAKQELVTFVTQPFYNELSDEDKVGIIKAAFRRARQEARERILFARTRSAQLPKNLAPAPGVR